MTYKTFPDPPTSSAIQIARQENSVELSQAVFKGISGARKEFEVPLHWAGVGGVMVLMLIVGWFGWTLIRDFDDPAVQFPEEFTREGFLYAAGAFLAVVFALLVFGLVGLLRKLRVAMRKAPTQAWTLRLEETRWSWTLHQMGKSSTGTCHPAEIDRIALGSECRLIAVRQQRRHVLTRPLLAADADWLAKHLNRLLGNSEKPAVLDTERRKQIFGGWFMAGIGLLALGLSVGLAVEQHRFASTALRTEGVVKNLVEHPGAERELSIVQYEVEGKAFEIQHDIGMSPLASNLGERVTVLYQAKRPDKGRVEGSSERWSIVLTFGIVAVVAFAISAFCFLAAVLGKRKDGQRPVGQGLP